MSINSSVDLLSRTAADAKNLLDYLHKNGIVDLGVVEEEMRRKEKEEKIGKVHPYYISKSGKRWQTYVYDESKPDKRKKIVKTNRDDLLNALLELYGLEKDDENKWTLTSLYPKWKEFKSLHVKSTCMSRIDRSWQAYYKGTDIVEKPIEKITVLELDEWAHRIIKKKQLTKTEYYNMSIIMRQGLDYAVHLNIIEQNPFRKVEINGRRLFKRTHKKPSSTQVFTDEQVQQICKLALDDFNNNKRLKYELAPLAVVFALKTGQRPSEVCADRYADIEGDHLHVQRMLEFETGNVIDSFKGTFDVFEERNVYLTPDALNIIRLCKNRQREKMVSDKGYIFSLTEEIGSGLWEAIENRIEKYSLEICGEKRSLTKARKTYISTALDAGINPDTVRRSVGHRDLNTTLNRYYYDRSSPEIKEKQFVDAFDKTPILFTKE